MADARSATPWLTEPRRRQLVGLGLGLCCLVMARAMLTRAEFISDDAWISMRYARNLVEGHGLRWNPGQEPVEGYSNLLWVLLGALGLAVGAPLPLWLNGLGLAFSAASVVGCYALARELGAGRGWGLFAAALCSVSALLAGTSLNGLETPSLVVLMTFGTLRALSEERQLREGRVTAPWSAALFGLLTIAHVEGPVYLIIPALIRASRALTPQVVDRAVTIRRDLLAIGLLFSPFIAQEAGRIFYYHDWMPNTVRIKGVGRAAKVSGLIGVRYVLHSLSCNPALALFSAVGVAALLGLKRGLSRVERVAGALLLLPWLSCAAFSIGVRGDMINQFRFMAPAVPTLLAAAVVGWSRLSQRLPGPLSLAFLFVPLGLGLVSANRDLSIQMVAHNRNPTPKGGGRWAEILAEIDAPFGTVQELPRHLSRLLPWSSEPKRPTESVPWFIGWVVENVPVGGTVMFPDVGLLSMALTDGLVLDARGLNSRGPAALLAASPPDGPEGMADPGVVAFLTEFKHLSPECLVVQTADGYLWGPPEAALQGDGVIRAYTGVATGRYNVGEVRVYLRGAPRPTLDQVLARYREMQRTMPGVLDWEARIRELEQGTALAAEARWVSSDDEIQLHPVGSWSSAATFPPGHSPPPQ